MIHVRAPQPGDLEYIGRHAAEEWVRDRINNGADFSNIMDKPLTRVAVIDDEPVALGGFIENKPDTAFAWSLVGGVPAQFFIGICRVFRRQIEASPYRWIEAHCIATFHQSHRWVRCLGFEPVNGERCFTPDGREFRKFVFRNHPHGA